ncbi:MAG: hypothetical protein PHY92_10575 [Alphaproteobacteria bacterium]|nr:hypothetical protein [Alphaproteobacteria bacterium]
MTDEYVSAKIKEALTATGGDKRDAQKLLITWAVRDQPLLIGLTKPHLKAIVSSWVDNAMRSPRKNGSQNKDVHFSKEEIDKIIATRPVGDKRSPVVPPPKSSVRQASVMHQLAAAFKKRKK